jgi:hypothetical protein
MSLISKEQVVILAKLFLHSIGSNELLVKNFKKPGRGGIRVC